MHAPESAEALYRQWAPKLSKLVYQRMRTASREDRQDALHDIFERAWRHIDTYDPAKGQFSTWLYNVANSAITARWRKTTTVEHGVRKPRPPVLSIEALAQTSAARRQSYDDGGEPVDLVLSGSGHHRWGRNQRTLWANPTYDAVEGEIGADELLGLLGPVARRILKLRYLDDRPEADVAHALGLSQSTVQNMAARARQTLRDHLEKGTESWSTSTPVSTATAPIAARTSGTARPAA